MKRKTKSKKVETLFVRPAVFVEAARLIGQWEETYACAALERISGYFCPEKRYFIKILKPKGVAAHRPWYGDKYFCTANRTARIIGLLLCAQLAKEKFNPWA